MNKSNLAVAIVVIATISTIAFVGISENTQAFSTEGTENIVEISIHDTIEFSDSVTISVSNDTSIQD